ncbi:MAG: acylglycerol kinase family protein, partial [Anaerolineales bacterium]|nr:acylglycerol kinase family protein [Anaerolineales bacterium]
MDVPYQRIHVIINPAAGQDEPILNTLNRVFHKYGVDWEVSITHRFGDAMRFAKQAVADGVELVVGYGGDGTQLEVLNGIMGSDTPMAILPGGTGNAMTFELNIPHKL